MEISCANCGKTKSIPPSYKKDKNFCDKSCHMSHRNKVSNPSWTRDLKGENNPMWGKHPLAWNKGVIGEESHNWKGGYTRKDGYKVIKIAGKKILVHRHILRDSLKDKNIVHHKDENPSNNTLENLEILPSQSEHATLHNLKRWHGNV